MKNSETLFSGRFPKRLPLKVIHFLDIMSSLTYVKYKTTIYTYWKMAGAKSGIKPLKSNVPEFMLLKSNVPKFTLQRRPEIWSNPYFTSVFHPKEATLQRRPEIIGGSYSNTGFYPKEAMIRKCLDETTTKDQKRIYRRIHKRIYG